ncbi:MAG: beta-galactosidase [Planctomycetota bacterium]|nr:MAG: beta-galactosidase [Planctomycetota bacterium]
MKTSKTLYSLSIAAAALLITLASCNTMPVSAQAKSCSAEMQPVNPPDRPILVGADYYPEHWPRERWETDIKLMKDAGFNVVRLAEFSWIYMEPTEGQYEFDWLDDVLDLLARNDIYAIICTPTAVMPAWLANKYPDAMAMKGNGTRITWGGRKNNCFSTGTYRLLSERITRAMAEHFRDNPVVIGWQTDNEFGGTDCRCSICRTEFQHWLRKKYGTLDELNRAWGNHFWGLEFTAWGEITIPDQRIGEWASSNPSACLDWKRFTSWLNVRFQADQIDIIREICPHHFVTHNFMGFHTGTNYYDMAADLDFVSFDNYPVWAKSKPEINYRAAAAADLMRGFKQKNFLIMEQTAGPHGWSTFQRNPWPGEIRLFCYQQLAHGADGQIWFRWRTCTAGREQYWHGLLGHDGKPLRRYKEAAQVAKEYRKLDEYLKSTTVPSDVAIIYDFDTVWALQFQPSYKGNDFEAVMSRYYNALFRAGVNVDFISPCADFSKYKLVLAPDLYVLPDKVANNLNDFVKQGGTLFTDCRVGVKDETNLCHPRTLPGLLSKALGIRIEEYSPVGGDVECKIAGTDDFPGSFNAKNYVDWVTAENADTLARYEGKWHLKPFAALTRNTYGQGKAWYAGTVIKEDAFYDQLIENLLKDAGVRPPVKPPLGVEVSIRQGNGQKLLFVINHTDEPKTVNVPAGKTELLTGKTTDGSITLDTFDVAVIKL